MDNYTTEVNYWCYADEFIDMKVYDETTKTMVKNGLLIDNGSLTISIFDKDKNCILNIDTNLETFFNCNNKTILNKEHFNINRGGFNVNICNEYHYRITNEFDENGIEWTEFDLELYQNKRDEDYHYSTTYFKIKYNSEIDKMVSALETICNNHIGTKEQLIINREKHLNERPKMI